MAVDVRKVPNTNGPIKAGSCQLGRITDSPATSTDGLLMGRGEDSAIIAEEKEKEKEGENRFATGTRLSKAIELRKWLL